MNTVLFVLALSAPTAPEQVTFETADGLQLVADFHDLEGETPTVICLPMYGSTREAYEPIVAPLREAGIQVLALDLRGHGQSAVELASKVDERDPALFNAMYQDVAAALSFLRERGEDTSRVSLLGASVGCSVGIDAVVRDPSSYRSIVLMTPGANYLGMDSLASLQQWPEVPALVLTSEEEKLKVAPVSDALEREAPQVSETLVLEGSGIHGTRMFGQVPEVEARLVEFYQRTLLEPALAIPRFAAEDPAVETPGFVARTLRVTRQREVQREVQGEARSFVLMVFAVGDTLTVGAMTKQAFAGVVRLELGERTLEGAWETSSKESVAFTAAGDDEALELEGQPGSFRGTSWVNVELPLAEWMPDGETSLRLTFLPADGEPLALPGGEAPFHAYLAER